MKSRATRRRRGRPPIVVPQAESLERAAELLNGGKKTVILAGQGALGAGDELERVADTLAAPIVKPLLGKAVVPDDSPYTTGGIGLLGTLPSEKAMEECDTLLMVGTSFPYMKCFPKPGQAKAVQIDRDPTRLGLRYPIDIGLIGDAKATLQALLPLLQRAPGPLVPREGPGADEGVVGADAQPRAARRRRRSSRRSSPARQRPARRRRHRHDRLGHDHHLGGAAHLKMRRGMKFSCSGNLATMAPGLPYAIGAQVAYPDRQVVAFVGDGGFTMLMGEFVTAVKHELPIKVVIIKNNTLGQIKWEQMVFLGNPEYGVELQPIDFVKFAEACGGSASAASGPTRCGPRWRRRSRPRSRRCRGGRRPVRAADAGPGDAQAGCTWPSRWCAASRTAARSP